MKCPHCDDWLKYPDYEHQLLSWECKSCSEVFACGTFEEVVALVCPEPSRSQLIAYEWPFGKYRGETLLDIYNDSDGRDYLSYWQEKDDFRGEARRYLSLFLALMRMEETGKAPLDRKEQERSQSDSRSRWPEESSGRKSKRRKKKDEKRTSKRNRRRVPSPDDDYDYQSGSVDYSVPF